jgi:hypothetical protein
LTVGINHHEAINKQMKDRLVQCNRDLANQRASKALRIRQIIRKWRALTLLGDEMQVISSVVQRMHRARVSFVIPRTLQNLVSYVSGLSILNIHVQGKVTRLEKLVGLYIEGFSVSQSMQI